MRDDLIVPVGPEARYYVEKKGWPFKLIGDFISPEDNQAGRVRSEDLIDDVVSQINHLHAGDPYPPLHDVGDYFRYELYMLVGQLLFSRQLLEALSKRYRLCVFENIAQKGKTILSIRPHPDCLFAGLARSCRYQDIEIVPYQWVQPSGEKLSLKRRLRAIIGGRGADILYSLAWQKIRVQYPGTWFSGGNRVLMLGGMFDWAPILFSPEFIAGYSVTFKMMDEYDFGREESDGPVIRSIDKILSKFVCGQEGKFDLSPIARKVDAFIRHVRQHGSDYEALVNYHEAILASVFVTPLQRLIGKLASRAGKPVICYQHGEMGFHQELFKDSFYEVGPTTHYFAYGKNVVPQYQPYIGKTRLKEVIAIGSTRKKMNYAGGNLIVYATGKWLKTVRPYIAVVDPDARLYEAQKKIIEFLAEHAKNNPADKVIVKANNTKDFNRIPFQTNLEIDYTSAFTDLLYKSKMVILDTPGTTAVEAASTSVPLFILSGRTPWYPEPMALLRKRAVVEEALDVLLERIRDYVANENYSADVDNREFPNAYGGELDASGAASSAIMHLTKILDGCQESPK